MADLPVRDDMTPQPAGRVDKFIQFDDTVITDPSELQSLYIPSPKNLTVIVAPVVKLEDQATPLPNSPNNGEAAS